MIIFHDKDGNRLAMTEAEALALGYTYEHIWKRVNPNRTSLNANELIEFQGNKASEARANGFSGEIFMQTATMLRQQQAEIEELKTKMSLNSYDDAKNVANQLLQVDNKPVAWMSSVGGEFVYVGYEPAEGYLAIPLYTHPAKTLTDEEIRKVADEVFKDYKNWHHYQIDFARAILRKAQEK